MCASLYFPLFFLSRRVRLIHRSICGYSLIRVERSVGNLSSQSVGTAASLSVTQVSPTYLFPFSRSSHSSSPSGFILLLFSSPRSLSSVSKDPECVLSLWTESRDGEEVWGERVDVWKSVRARIGLWSSFLRTTLPRWYHIHRNLVCV